MVFEVEIPRGDRPKQEVTVTREAGLLRVDASVRFSGHTAGVTWFSPQYEIIHRPVMVLGGFHGKHACYLQPLPQEKRLEIGDMFQHEAVAFA